MSVEPDAAHDRVGTRVDRQRVHALVPRVVGREYGAAGDRGDGERCDHTPILARLMRLLVTGGAGYIGSIVAQQLVARGDEVTVLDSLYRGHRAAVPEGADFVQADLLDPDALAAVFARCFDGVAALRGA